MSKPALREAEPLYWEPCRDFQGPASCYTNDGTGLWCDPCDARRSLAVAAHDFLSAWPNIRAHPWGNGGEPSEVAAPRAALTPKGDTP